MQDLWVLYVQHSQVRSALVHAQVLEAYEKTLTEVPASEAYEHSELILYKVGP
jgi:hypothetical protein